MALSITTILDTYITEWHQSRTPKRRRSVSSAINKHIDMLSDLLYFSFDEESIGKICIASTIVKRPRGGTAGLLRKLKGQCTMSKRSIRSLLSYIVERLSVTTIIFYVEQLITFGVDMPIVNYVYEEIFHYMNCKPNITEDRIIPILKALSRFSASTSTVYNIIRESYSNKTANCLKYLNIVDCANMSREYILRIFCVCINRSLNPMTPSMVHSLCDMHLIPDSAFVLNDLVDQMRYYYTINQMNLSQVLNSIIAHRPSIIPAVKAYSCIVERYISWNDLHFPHMLPAEYILDGIHDDYYVPYDDIKLYGIQQNPITKLLERMLASHHYRHQVVVVLLRCRGLFSDCH